MCGIAGLMVRDPSAPVDRIRLQAMVDSLVHRGPDDCGFHVDANVGFGMRRLSIVDPEGGHQPVANEDGSVVVVYNGECYNFADLAAELLQAGHRFRSRTDTEILVHGYESWGIRGLVSRLNGIFAFCLWDARTRTAYLVRDRLGVKPLYYIARESALAFSSEIRSLVWSGLCLPKLDEQSVWRYLSYQFTPTEQTPLAGVVRLPAAHIAEWRADRPLRVEPYWRLQHDEQWNGNFEQAVDEVGALLDDAVKRQLLGDVPIGCFLSGGLDSSAVAALMAAHASGSVRTYSIGFPSSYPYDEAPHALAAARAIGTMHTMVSFDERRFGDCVAGYLARVDEPIGDAAMLPTDLLAAAAVRDVKVVLTGEGADEVFGGYGYYRHLSATDVRAPGEWQGLLRRVDGGGYRPVPVPGSASAHSGFPYMLQPESIWTMLAQDRRPSFETFRDVLFDVEGRHLDALRHLTPLQRAMELDRRIWLGHDLLTKIDKATMAHGLEARVPMLDHRLVELAAVLPDAYKVGASSKMVMRQALRGLLPPALLDRQKQGFGVPLDDWFRGPLRTLVRERFHESALVADGILTPGGIDALLNAHGTHGVPLGRAIWAILNIDEWWRHLQVAIAKARTFARDQPTIVARTPATVDIVIPVCGGLNLIRDCVRSIQRSTSLPFRAIVVDDGGDDDFHARLRRLTAGDPRFELLRNHQALGYLRTCLRAMERSTAKYIVLLNSDTVVTPTWLERLVACAESDPDIAVVNPLTNESGNTSVRFAPGLNLLTMAQRVAQISRRRYPAVTTAVGMCMLIRRSAIDLLGGLDPAFDPAYCEESDLCMRFTEAGLRVVVAEDAFVYHKGSGSYTTDVKDALYTRNRRLFDARWRVAYERDFAAYARADPLQPARDALLRGTTRSSDDAAIVGAAEEEMHQLSTVRALAAGADGARASVTGMLLSERRVSARTGTTRVLPVRRTLGPDARFEQRAVAFPSRAYVAGLPSAAPGALRITFLVQSLPLCGGVVSICQLAREFLAAGHEVKLVTEIEMIEPESLNLWLQPIVYRNRDHLVDAFPASDIVVATFWTTAHDYLGPLKQRYDFTSVYFIQDYEAWFYDEADYATRRRVVQSYAAADHRIVKSRWLADMVGRHGNACEVIPIGLDLGVFYPRARRTARPRIAAVASVYERRGFAAIAKAFERVHQARPDVELVFFGLDSASMPPVPFPYTNAGRITDPNRVAELLSDCDVLMDLSIWQGFGRPGLEAIACGAVPILTNVGGIVEYARHGENCMLVDPRDSAAAADAALTVLGDAALLARLREGGRTTASRFGHEAEARAHLACYRKWLGPHA